MYHRLKSILVLCLLLLVFGCNKSSIVNEIDVNHDDVVDVTEFYNNKVLKKVKINLYDKDHDWKEIVWNKDGSLEKIRVKSTNRDRIYEMNFKKAVIINDSIYGHLLMQERKQKKSEKEVKVVIFTKEHKIVKIETYFLSFGKFKLGEMSYYKDSYYMKESFRDYNYDGIWNLMYTYNEIGLVVKVQQDYNDDKIIDRVEDISEEVNKVSIDTNFDGAMDRWEYFNTSDGLLVKVEIDNDSDGIIDITKIQNDGIKPFRFK